MSRIDNLIAVRKAMPDTAGWVCVRLTNVTVTMRHPVHGDRLYRVGSHGKVSLRESVPRPPDDK